MNFPIETPEWSDLSPSLGKIIREIVAGAGAQSNPFLLHTAGIPGAGKSSLADSLEKSLADLFPVRVAFDKIMCAIPEYSAEPDSLLAFSKYELPARAAGYLLVKNLMEKRANIIFDHSASFPKHVDLLKFAKSLGYKVAFVRIVAAPETVKKRILARQAVEGRHTPLNYVDERLVIIEKLLEDYKAVSDVYFEIQNDDRPLVNRMAFFQDASERIAKGVRDLVAKPS
jgi:predicted ABC-type ATPase